MDDFNIFDHFAEKLAHVEPEIRNEGQAYKKAVIRMAIKEYMNHEAAIIEDAFERHG